VNWTAHYFCTGCGERLTDDQIRNSDGVCPLCGRVSPGSSVEVRKKAARWKVTYTPDWLGWLLGLEEQGQWEYREPDRREIGLRLD
jgi:hypothetical protein